MRLSFTLQTFITYFLAVVPIFAHPTQVSGPRELVEAANSQNGMALTHLRYTEIPLPPVHVEDIYVNTAHALHKNFATQLSPWTHSNHFRKNSTFRPVITASFNPFSAVEWLVFNSTTLDLSGQTPFAEASYNVSVTLIPMFVNKTEDIVIIPEFNNTPITFASTTFSIHVLSRGPSDADLQGWTPYILVILSAIAMISVICVLATCFWQDLCSPCKRRSSRRVDGNPEETEKPEEKATSKPRSIRQRFTETDWSFLRDVAHRQEMGQITPYDPLPSSTSISPKPNIHAIREKRLFRDDGFQVLSTSSSDTLGVQYVSITGGIFFAVEINIDGRASDEDHHGQQTDYRAHATPYAPEWIHLCPDRMILWGTPPEHISLTGIFKFDVSVIKNTSGSIVGRLSFNLVAQQATTASDLFSAIFSGTDKDVRYEHSNGIDTLSILSGSEFAIQYHPRGLKRQPVQQGRYYFNCAQALPPWLAFDSDTLEIKGDTTGYRRRDLRDLLVIDRFTRRTVSKLRVILVVNEDRA